MGTTALRGEIAEPTDRPLQPAEPGLLGAPFYRAAFEHLPDGVCVVGPDGTVSAGNLTFLDLFDLPAELLAGGVPLETVYEHIVRADPRCEGKVTAEVNARMAFWESERAVTFRVMRPNRQVVECRRRPFIGGTMTVFRDVTEEWQRGRDAAARHVRARATDRLKSFLLECLRREAIPNARTILGASGVLAGAPALAGEQRQAFGLAIREAVESWLERLDELVQVPGTGASSAPGVSDAPLAGTSALDSELPREDDGRALDLAVCVATAFARHDLRLSERRVRLEWSIEDDAPTHFNAHEVTLRVCIAELVDALLTEAPPNSQLHLTFAKPLRDDGLAIYAEAPFTLRALQPASRADEARFAGFLGPITDESVADESDLEIAATPDILLPWCALTAASLGGEVALCAAPGAGTIARLAIPVSKVSARQSGRAVFATDDEQAEAHWVEV